MKNLNFPGLPHVLVIDDEEQTREQLRAMLQAEGVAVETVTDAESGIRRLGQKGFDIVFFDVHLPGTDAFSILPTLRRGTPAADVLVLTDVGADSSTIETMRKGASDVLSKPLDSDRVLGVVRRTLETRQLRSELNWVHDRVRELTATELLGLSPEIHAVQTRIDQVAHAPDATVLICGDTGTGKELVARSIHERSSRRHGPFVSLNCASLTESLLETELFGSEAGAFAGQREGKEGLFSLAAGGTLFLDDIAEMPGSVQTKLLRVLQERTFRKVGGTVDNNADMRVIAATKRDLRAELEAGRFREELYYRLNAVTVEVPRLTDRSKDVPLLAHFFLDQFSRQMGKSLSGFNEEAMETLCEYEWPGNVRELRNAIERAAIVCPKGMIEERHLPSFTGGVIDGSDAISRGAIHLDVGDRSIRNLEGKLVARVLEETRWNISKAASILGINRTTLYNKIRLHGLGHRPNRSKVVAHH